MQVLLVEDDQFFGQQIKELLHDRGVDVILAQSAEEALNQPAEDCDGAIIDVMLPNDPLQSGITNGLSAGICKTHVFIGFPGF